jgi:hypothetical protein
MWTVVPNIYNVFTARHIQASIFNCTDLSCYWWYIDNSMCAILPTWCQIRRICRRLRYVNCGPGHIQRNNSSTYSGFNIQLNVSPPLLEIYRQFSVGYTAILVANTAHILQFRYLNCGPGRTHCDYSSSFSGFNFQLRVSALILDMCRQFDAPYTANLEPNTAHILQITLCDCGPGHIYNVFTAPHIQASIFKWTYLRCHCWYIDNAMCVILRTWYQVQCTSSSLRYLNCGSGHIQCTYSSTYSGFNIQLNVSPP